MEGDSEVQCVKCSSTQYRCDQAEMVNDYQKKSFLPRFCCFTPSNICRIAPSYFQRVMLSSFTGTAAFANASYFVYFPVDKIVCNELSGFFHLFLLYPLWTISNQLRSSFGTHPFRSRSTLTRGDYFILDLIIYQRESCWQAKIFLKIILCFMYFFLQLFLKFDFPFFKTNKSITTLHSLISICMLFNYARYARVYWVVRKNEIDVDEEWNEILGNANPTKNNIYWLTLVT